jgi:hypothetical protein
MSWNNQNKIKKVEKYFNSKVKMEEKKMSIEEKVSLTVSIFKSYRDRLRTMAAQQNLHDPDKLTSASTIAREIICEHLDKLEFLEENFKAAHHEVTTPNEAKEELPLKETAENLEKGERNEPCLTTTN